MRFGSPRLFIIAASVLATLLLAIFFPTKTVKDVNLASFSTVQENPLWNEFREVGRELGIDVSFAERVKYQRRIDMPDHPIFCEPAQSFDVIFFGDSIVEWSMSREVVEQVSGLRVAFFAFEGSLLNRALLPFLEQIRSYYLKPDGMSIFMFSHWTQNKEPDVISNAFLNYKELQNRGFVESILARRKCNDIPAKAENTEPGGRLMSQGSLARYEQTLAGVRSDLRRNFHMTLPQVSAYSLWLEPFVNPEWSKRKNGHARETHLRWNGWSLLVFNGNYNDVSGRNTKPPSTSRDPIEKEQRESAKALINFPGHKVYGIPYVNANWFPAQRTWHDQLYREHFELMDLAALHPQTAAYPMQADHMANTGMLYMSYTAGKWLREHFKRQSQPISKTAISRRS